MHRSSVTRFKIISITIVGSLLQLVIYFMIVIKTLPASNDVEIYNMIFIQVKKRKY